MQRNSLFPFKPLQKADTGSCFNPPEPAWAQLTACPFWSFCRWLRTARSGLEKQTATSLLRGKQYGLDFSSQDLKVILYCTNATKCLQSFSL